MKVTKHQNESKVTKYQINAEKNSSKRCNSGLVNQNLTEREISRADDADREVDNCTTLSFLPIKEARDF